MFPFTTCANTLKKRKLFLFGKNTNVKQSDWKKLVILLCLKNWQVSAIFYWFQKNCRYLPMPINQRKVYHWSWTSWPQLFIPNLSTSQINANWLRRAVIEIFYYPQSQLALTLTSWRNQWQNCWFAVNWLGLIGTSLFQIYTINCLKLSTLW